MVSKNDKLKQQVYEMLRRHAVAVFFDDILDPSKLNLCGVKLPVSGLGLFKILVELVKERKLVIWRDDGTYGFLPAKRWRKELSAIREPLRSDCEAMRLKGREAKRIEKSMINIITSFAFRRTRTYHTQEMKLPDKL